MASTEGVARLEYDAEYHVGLVPNDPTPAIAVQNRIRLTNALSAQASSGLFSFVHTRIGPLTRIIKCASKEFFFSGTIETPARMGGGIIGGGGIDYLMSEDQYGSGGQGGATTRFTRIDGEGGGPLIRLNGTGFVINHIGFKGQRWPLGNAGLTGTPCQSIIEVAGRSNPSSGLHHISNCSFSGANYGIYCPADPEESHGDQSRVTNCWFGAVDSCFRSENQQALGWSFHDIKANNTFSDAMVVFDIVRGGNIYASNVILNHHKVKLFKVTEFSPNTGRLVCDGFRWDTFNNLNYYLTMFEYAGPVYPAFDMSYIRYSVRCSGHIANDNPSVTYDWSKLVVIPDQTAAVGILRTDLMFDVFNLFPSFSGFTAVGSGPWYHPN